MGDVAAFDVEKDPVLEGELCEVAACVVGEESGEGVNGDGGLGEGAGEEEAAEGEK